MIRKYDAATEPGAKGALLRGEGLYDSHISYWPTPSSESSQVRWVPASELPGYTMDRSMRIRIDDFLSRSESPVIT